VPPAENLLEIIGDTRMPTFSLILDNPSAQAFGDITAAGVNRQKESLD
jgi:hypothetical protein